YTKNVRNARRTEVIGDLSNLALRENAMMSARGHYASTTSNEDDAYPVAPNELANHSGAIQWDITQPGYTSDAVAVGTPYFQAGGLVNGYVFMNFLPMGSHLYCTNEAISADVITGEFGDAPPIPPLGTQVSPVGDPQLQRFYARDWFYASPK